jgi:UDP-2,4-diacetamido-2,4,6-trideoxy-beta-L-altropyranose hydrolase
VNGSSRIAVIVANATVSVGGGHLRRCLVLGEALVAAGWKVALASTDEGFANSLGPANQKIEVLAVREYSARALVEVFPNGCDLLVVDHYGLDVMFESSCRDWTKRILVVDDLANRQHNCDVLVDQTPGRTICDYRALVPTFCQTLVGPQYALLHRNFGLMRTPRRPTPNRVRRALISFGATDPDDMTTVAMRAVKNSGLKLELDVILGGEAPHIERVEVVAAGFSNGEAKVHLNVSDPASIVRHADIAIGAGGVSALERCCLGIPSLIVSLADNQMGNAMGIARSGGALFVGNMSQITCSLLEAALLELANDSKARDVMTTCGRGLCDGLGADRVADLLALLVVEQ